ncbi:hypothetical protein HanXRQr2_Chr15g0712511 [Helianthus annuus]|uniref:Uncharacterized protein n=1 Tax=Helianthus annuus TaxID=4232 RepID=A0A9K3H4U1_HELAN|nr:hypothetical protein HanXRQr2_Chr15g0712511 [Helianthus annuus]
MTSHDSSQNVNLMNAAVCNTRYPSPPQSSRRTILAALSSISDFQCSISFNSFVGRSSPAINLLIAFTTYGFRKTMFPSTMTEPELSRTLARSTP